MLQYDRPVWWLFLCSLFKWFLLTIIHYLEARYTFRKMVITGLSRNTIFKRFSAIYHVISYLDRVFSSSNVCVMLVMVGITETDTSTGSILNCYSDIELKEFLLGLLLGYHNDENYNFLTCWLFYFQNIIYYL